MLDINELNDNVREDIASNLGIQDTDELTLKLKHMSVNAAFESFLNWNGIIGYASLIAKALDNIRAAERLQIKQRR